MPRPSTSNAHRKRSEIIRAVNFWWAHKRPEGWTIEQHEAQWWVNCTTSDEVAMAQAVVTWRRHPRELPPRPTVEGAPHAE